MTTSRRHSMWSAICAVILALVLGASPLAFAPAASAHGGLTCEPLPPPNPGSTSGHAETYCEGHGIAILMGQCGSRTAVNTTVFDHHGGTAWVDCALVGTTGPMTHITLQIAYYAGEGPEDDPPPEDDPLPACSSGERCCAPGPDGACRDCVPAHAECQ
jgi:hypothetical protein